MNNPSQYASLFDNYAAGTDGKTKIANALIELYPAEANLLDVGAGAGEIARAVSGHFRRVVALEPNKSLLPKLSANSPTSMDIVPCAIQDFETTETFDIVLLSYVLDTMSTDDIGMVLRRIKSLVKPTSRVVFATYLEGCDWDIYSEFIRRNLSTKRTGGYSRLVRDLRSLGCYTHIRSILDTTIFADTLQQLYDRLAFFYKEQIDAYNAGFSELSGFLGKLAGDSSRLAVKEVVAEILGLANDF